MSKENGEQEIKLKNSEYVNNLSDDNITKCVNNIILKEDFLNYKLLNNIISTGGGNYFGDLYEINIKGQTRSGYKETNLFVKQKKVLLNANQCIRVNEMFSKEVFVYKSLAKVFEKLQEDANIPVHDRYKMVKCYDESNEKIIIMENLAKKGYKTLSRMDTASIQFTKLSLIQLAKFHALSFVLQKSQPEYLKNNIENLNYPVNFDNNWVLYIQNIFRQEIQSVNIDMKDTISNILPVFLDKMPYYLSGKLSTTMCLCHGDYRVNNILVKYKEENVADIIPIDYQFIFYGSPVFDLLYLIFSCTDRQFRKDHLEELKVLYHDSLKDFLQYFYIDIDSVYSRKQFEEDYKDYLDYGLLFSCLLFPFFFAEEDGVPDVENTDLQELSFNLGNTFKERMEELIQDYVDWGYL